MKFLIFALAIIFSSCGSFHDSESQDATTPHANIPDASNSGPATLPQEPLKEFPKFIFEETGDEIGAELIDLQQLPDGRWLVASRAGDFFLLSESFQIIDTAFLTGVDLANDFGLQNIEVAPDFGTSGDIFVYYTPGFPDPSPPCDGVRCARLDKVELDLTIGIEIAGRSKVLDVPAVGTHIAHYGGGMAFLGEDLYLATGDGGSSVLVPNDPQADDSLLGKLLRILPSGAVEIYAKGLRNPFTMTAGNGGLLIANVGAKAYEEINFAEGPGLNFGWPLNEGPSDLPGITGPIHGYPFADDAFIAQDPQGEPNPAKTVIAGIFYQGPGYGGALERSLLYNEFFAGWVRALQFDFSGGIVADRHVAHFSWITAMKAGTDGNIYAVSLYGSTRVLKLKLITTE